MAETQVKAGRRERSKADKLQRITQAARTLFREKGYDATTINDISERADVAAGTVFAYAKDKRDLLFLVLNDGMNAALDHDVETLNHRAPLIDQLVHLFAGLYEFYSTERELAVAGLRELHIVEASIDAPAQIQQFLDRRHRTEKKITEIIERAQREERISKQVLAEDVSIIVATIYAATVRAWLHQPDQDVWSGLMQLRGRLSLFLRGVGPAPGQA